MKRRYAIVFFAVLLFVVVGCRSENDEPQPSTNHINSVTAYNPVSAECKSDTTITYSEDGVQVVTFADCPPDVTSTPLPTAVATNTPQPTPTLRPTNTPAPTPTRGPQSTARRGAAFGFVPGGRSQVDFRRNDLGSTWQYVWGANGDNYACELPDYEHIIQLRPDKHPTTPTRAQFEEALCAPGNYVLVFNECEVWRSFGQCGTAPEDAAVWYREQIAEKYAGIDYRVILGNSNAHNSFTGSKWLDQFVAAYGILAPEVVGIGFHVYPAFDLNGKIGVGNLDRERVSRYVDEYEQFLDLCNERPYCRDQQLWLTEIGFTRNSKSPCGKNDAASADCLQQIYDGTDGFTAVNRWAMYAGDERFADLSEGNGSGPITEMGKIFTKLKPTDSNNR